MSHAQQLALISPLLTIGGLPSMAEIGALGRKGIISLVNVSGIPLSSLYDPLALSKFRIDEQRFSDIFSTNSAQELPSTLPEVFSAQPVALPRAFGIAVASVIGAWRQGNSVYLFCHQGVGRAPAVALAAIHFGFKIPLEDATAIVEKMRPQALVTNMSLAAANWYRQIHEKS